MTFSPNDFALWMSVAKDASVVGVLLFVLWGGSKRVWVWGHHYVELTSRVDKLESEIDWWQERYLALGDTANRAISVAERRKR